MGGAVSGEELEEEVYEGEQDENHLYHGRGTLFYPSSDPRAREKYEGEFFNGRRHGWGRLSWSNGAVYEGEWADDKLHGEGTLSWQNGFYYSGQWSANKFHGSGEVLYPNGKRYHGKWSNNHHDGCGILYYTSSDSRRRTLYEGEWLQGKRHGCGSMIWNNGAVYVGDWVNGKRHGFGEHTFPNGERYIGYWKNGKREGFGRRYFISGDWYEGHWVRDKKDGPGIYHYAYGKSVKQEWQKGVQLSTPPVVSSLLILCIEKVGRDPTLLNKANVLPTELHEKVAIYHTNEVKSSEDTVTSFSRVLDFLGNIGSSSSRTIVNDIPSPAAVDNSASNSQVILP